MTQTAGPEHRHLEHVAFLEAFGPAAAPDTAADWCDIRNSFPVGQHYLGAYTLFDYGAKMVFTVNPDATLRVVNLNVLGKDRTKEALANGGESITVTPNSKYGHDCRRYDYYLAWELSGPFVEWAAALVQEKLKVVKPTDFLLYTRYSGPGDPKKWFYFYLLGWKYTELVPVPSADAEGGAQS